MFDIKDAEIKDEEIKDEEAEMVLQNRKYSDVITYPDCSQI